MYTAYCELKRTGDLYRDLELTGLHAVLRCKKLFISIIFDFCVYRWQLVGDIPSFLPPEVGR